MRVIWNMIWYLPEFIWHFVTLVRCYLRKVSLYTIPKNLPLCDFSHFSCTRHFALTHSTGHSTQKVSVTQVPLYESFSIFTSLGSGLKKRRYFNISDTKSECFLKINIPSVDFDFDLYKDFVLVRRTIFPIIQPCSRVNYEDYYKGIRLDNVDHAQTICDPVDSPESS